MGDIWRPQPGPQLRAIQATWCHELFFGGARGGGKSDFLLGDFLQDVNAYGEHWRGVIFRRSYDELEDLIVRAHQMFPGSGGEWRAGKKTYEWGNGAYLRFRYLERDEDANKYQGHQYTWIGVDELAQWPDPGPYKKLAACLRSAALVPTKRIRATGNPGGSGHAWVMERYQIEDYPLGHLDIQVTDTDTGYTTSRMFIPSKVTDNKILLDNDPGYISNLKQTGSAALVQAWLEGDWSAIVGAYFPEFNHGKHVLEPFEIPGHWLRFGSMDWGSAKPFCFGWYAVSDGHEVQTQDGGRVFPKGALIKYREWYGASEANVGLKMPTEDVGRGVLERMGGDRLQYTVVDPSMFKEDGGPSHAERLIKTGLPVRRADNNRLAGWDSLRGRLLGTEGVPMLYFFNTCPDTIRTLPTLQHDSRRQEDVDTDGDDHAADETRYAVMSRSWVKSRVPKRPTEVIRIPTLNDLWKDQATQRRILKF